MNKTIRVSIEKEYEIDISDDILTPEFVTEFESYMWELDGDTFEEKASKLFGYAARHLALYDLDFIEGLGPAASVRTTPFRIANGEKVNVVWNDIYEDVETEIM